MSCKIFHLNITPDVISTHAYSPLLNSDKMFSYFTVRMFLYISIYKKYTGKAFIVFNKSFYIKFSVIIVVIIGMYDFSLIFLSNRNTDFYSAFFLWGKKKRQILLL